MGGPRSPGNWDQTAGPCGAQLKEDSRPGPETAASLPSQGTPASLQSPGAEISHRGTRTWGTHAPLLKAHFFGGV